MNVKKYISSYVKTADVKAPIAVTITAVEEREFKNEDKVKVSLVLFTKELEQGIVLGSREVLEQLVELTGSPETDQWIGKKVELFNDPSIKFAGKRVGGLRFRAVGSK